MSCKLWTASVLFIGAFAFVFLFGYFNNFFPNQIHHKMKIMMNLKVDQSNMDRPDRHNTPRKIFFTQILQFPEDNNIVTEASFIASLHIDLSDIVSKKQETSSKIDTDHTVTKSVSTSKTNNNLLPKETKTLPYKTMQSISHEKSQFSESKTTTTIAPLIITNPGISVAYSFDNGRLGNQMSSLASLLALEWDYGIRAYVYPNQLEKLRLYFVNNLFNKTVRNLADDFPHWKNISWEFSFPDIENSNKSHWPPQKYGKFYHIGNYPIALNFFKKFINKLRQIFQFKRRYAEEAFLRLIEMSQKFESNDTNITFVSLHSRRSDYGYHLNNLYNLTYVEDSYFFRAMDHCRNKYKNVLFYVITDDIEWALQTFVNETRDVFITGTKNNFNLDGQPISKNDSVGIDMSMLGLANHSILTYGTFGMWGALLAGGDIVMPETHEKEEIRNILESDHLAGFDLV